MFSISIELIHSPPDLMTSLVRSVICRKPSDRFSRHHRFRTSRRPCASALLRRAEIVAANPRAAHLQRAERVTVPGQSCQPSSTMRISTPKIPRPALVWIATFVGTAISMPAFSVLTVPSGLISVMPQPWCTRRRARRETRDHRLGHGGAADDRALQLFRLLPDSSRYCSSASQTVGTPSDKVTASTPSRMQRFTVAHSRPGQDELGAHHQRGIGNAPGIDVKQRHHRQTQSRLTDQASGAMPA